MRTAAQWQSLSGSYRSRLERAGISQSDYIRGIPLSGARGHARTPERPATAERNPGRYQQYLSNRNSLVNKIQGLKANLFSGRPKWNAQHSRKSIESDPSTGKPRSIASLRKILAKLEEHDNSRDPFWERWDDVFDELEDDIDALYYH